MKRQTFTRCFALVLGLALPQISLANETAHAVDHAETIEEIVVKVIRKGRQEAPMSPTMRKLLSEIEVTKRQRAELEWLASRRTLLGSKIKYGYDPSFEFKHRQTQALTVFRNDVSIRPALIRLDLEN